MNPDNECGRCGAEDAIFIGGEGEMGVWGYLCARCIKDMIDTRDKRIQELVETKVKLYSSIVSMKTILKNILESVDPWY